MPSLSKSARSEPYPAAKTKASKPARVSWYGQYRYPHSDFKVYWLYTIYAWRPPLLPRFRPDPCPVRTWVWNRRSQRLWEAMAVLIPVHDKPAYLLDWLIINNRYVISSLLGNSIRSRASTPTPARAPGRTLPNYEDAATRPKPAPPTHIGGTPIKSPPMKRTKSQLVRKESRLSVASSVSSRPSESQHSTKGSLPVTCCFGWFN